MPNTEIQALEKQIYDLNIKLVALRKSSSLNIAVPNYSFQTQRGDTTLLDLFGDNDTLLVIHNMGQGCRYCTLWADGFNGLLPHLESIMGVVLVSKDAPDLQRQFANSRDWRFHLVSHAGGDYIVEQSVQEGQGNVPGAVIYQREGDRITRKHASSFGPGDQYCAMWSLLGLAGLSPADWTPQYAYWKQPSALDDGENVL
ncbi:MAG: hypothetical protein COB04_19315 [Gammaproteobacteria bacterium]|nr:MAG: hypothetical protein COB04_19315 [Gammaproteobacteria bacterium]